MIILFSMLCLLLIILLQNNNSGVSPKKGEIEKEEKSIKEWTDCWSGTFWESEYNCFGEYVVGENKGLAVSGDDFCKNNDTGLSGLFHVANKRWSIRPGSECVSQYVNDGEVADNNVTCSTIVNKPTRYICKDNGKKILFSLFYPYLLHPGVIVEWVKIFT